MKKIIRAFGVFGLAVLMTLGMASTAFAASGSWRSSNGSWWYAYSGGGYARGWTYIGSDWYHFNNSGWMQTGWLNVDGGWYYLNSSGAMAEGWKKVASTWYYFLPGSGAMQKGWLHRDGSWYYLGASGGLTEGWAKIGDYWYYFLPSSGSMRTGWQWIGNDWYYFDSSGAMKVNTWVGNYFVGLSGAMQRNQWVGLYYVDANGVKVPGLVQSPTDKSQFTYAVGDYLKNDGTATGQVMTGSIDASGGTLESLPGDEYTVMSSAGFALNSGYNCGHGVYITGYKGASGSAVVIPDTIDGEPVVYANLTSSSVDAGTMQFKYVNATQATHLRWLTVGGTPGGLYCEGLTQLRYLNSLRNGLLTSFDGSTLTSLQVLDFGTLPAKFSIAKQSLVSFSLLYSASDRVMPYIDLSNATKLETFSIGRTGSDLATRGPLTSNGYSLSGCTALTTVELSFQNITTFNPYQFPNLRTLLLANDPLTPSALYTCQLWAQENPGVILSL